MRMVVLSLVGVRLSGSIHLLFFMNMDLVGGVSVAA
jgi:hypothetical protein